MQELVKTNSECISLDISPRNTFCIPIYKSIKVLHRLKVIISPVKAPTHQHAFTLLELLVVIAILGALIGAGSAALSTAMGKSKLIAEMTAAKTLITAYQAAAMENGGRFLPAHNSAVGDIQNAQGQSLPILTKTRYPFRLAPYFNYAIEGTLLVGDNEKQFKVRRDAANDDYWISAYPAFGMNLSFVGGKRIGDDSSGNERWDTFNTAPDCIRSMANAGQSVIAFITAGGGNIAGYEYVKAPGGPGSSWSPASWSDNSRPEDYGNVYPRHDGKAVAAFLDGSVKMLSLEELRDMRLWSREAHLRDDPNYTVGSN